MTIDTHGQSGADDSPVTASHSHPNIIIDRKRYTAPASALTGAQLRDLAEPHIGPDRDLWQEVPGGEDRLVGNDEVVQLRDGEHFYSSPSNINPG